MPGFPGRVSFAELGGVRQNAGPITDERKQVGAPTFNAVHWQVAGMNTIASLVSLVVADDGTRESGGEAWNPDDDPAKRVAIDHPNTGEYVITAEATQYEDWSETLRDVIFRGALISPISATSVRPPTYTLDSATQITVYTWNAAGAATDMGFTIEIK